MAVFIEAAFSTASNLRELSDPNDTWKDFSTEDYFDFRSNFGVVKLRKRLAPPYTYIFVKSSKLYFGYGDPASIANSLEQAAAHVDAEVFYGTEFMHAVADYQSQSFTIQRDALCTLPIFIGVNKTEIIVSNHYSRVFELLGHSTLDINQYALCMQLLGASVGETLFNPIHTLVDRARAVWKNGEFSKFLPQPGPLEQVVANRTANSHDFFAHLEDTLTYYNSQYSSAAPFGAELSCGLDSSVIVGHLSTTNQPVLPVTFTYVGKDRDSLMSRLAEFEARFTVRSHKITMDPDSDFPLAQRMKQRTFEAFYTEEEIYSKPTIAAAKYLSSKGAQTVYRGVGGDDLFENIPALFVNSSRDPLFPKNMTMPEYTTPAFHQLIRDIDISQQRTPIPLVARSVAAAGLSSSNCYIDYNIWPILPLADPNLYLYCQGLPMRYRNERNILRAYLHARGYPESIYQPRYNENFHSFFMAATPAGLSAVFERYMTTSVLAEMGLIDPELALRSWPAAIQEGATRKLYLLYCLLKIEINLQLRQARMQAKA
jgi:hypothetical protein